jgi:adenosylcobinamide-phosphate synthase
MLTASSAALLLGYLLDLHFGDPRGFPHIVRGTGRLIEILERLTRRLFPGTPAGERRGGLLMVALVLLICGGLSFGVLFAAYRISLWLGLAVEAFFCYQLLAVKSLGDESMKVYQSLRDGDLPGARRDVSMIVGRDAAGLDAAGVTRAAVETVAENSSDGVVAPLFYLMLGGGVLGCLYKAVNTMDSMVGYKNERYLHFGRAAARLDDVANFIPARLAARLMILAAFLTGMDGKSARRVYLRDRFRHASPNSAHTEAVCAGALNIRLAGDAHYFGKLHHKPFLGDDKRPVDPEDIPRAVRLMKTTAWLMLVLALFLRGALMGGLFLAAI